MNRAGKTAVALLLVGTASAASSSTTVYYQPTPYPAGATGGVHVLDGWLPSVYYGKTFQQDDKLQVGGWGDNYRTYIQFDLTGLPASVSNAQLDLYGVPKGDSSTLIGFDAWNPGTAWATSNLTTSMTWDTQPTGDTLVSSMSAGTSNTFWHVPLTSLYNGWRAGTTANHGIVLMPWANNNNFDVWRSSRTTDDGHRPILELTYTPPVTVPDFKMPLPRNVAWLVTTEAGGYDCAGAFDSNHSGSNYFSIDFSWQNHNANGAQVYGSPAGGTDIPILAAATGRVESIISTSSDPNFSNNGYFVAHLSRSQR